MGQPARLTQRDGPTYYGSEMKAREDFQLATSIDGTEPNKRLGIGSDSALESLHNPARFGTVRSNG